MFKTKTTLLVPLFIIIVMLFSCLYIINEGQKALVLRLGKIVINPDTKSALVIGPGIHVKLPFITKIKIFDTRLQTLDIKSSRIVTKEKKDVIVNYYVKWRIENLPVYFKVIGSNEFQAGVLLEQNLNTVLRAEFGKRTIGEVVSGERDAVLSILRNNAIASVKSLGIQVVDIRIKGIDLPTNASQAVFNKMRAEMEKSANKHRADGRATAEAINAVADAKATLILAKANSLALMTRAKGKATAAQIYTAAYIKNPQFFVFYRSLLAYQEIFKSKNSNVLVLRPDSKFFEYFNQYNLAKDGES